MSEDKVLEILIEYEKFGPLSAVKLIRNTSASTDLLGAAKYLKFLVKEFLDKEILQSIDNKPD